jgi:three-Cys-motif partner protein
MSKPHETLWELEDHSRAKHEILRRYLGGWIPVMSKWNSRLVLVDGFAGPGTYRGGEDGSPIIMLKAFLEHDRRDLINAELVYAFIEEDDRRVQHLEGEIEKLGRLPEQVRLDVISGNFEAVFRQQLEDLHERGARLAPTFAFIDPFGYTDAPLDLTGSILQFDRCEVLIYLPIPSINRFIGRERAGRADRGAPARARGGPLAHDERGRRVPGNSPCDPAQARRRAARAVYPGVHRLRPSLPPFRP